MCVGSEDVDVGLSARSPPLVQRQAPVARGARGARLWIVGPGRALLEGDRAEDAGNLAGGSAVGASRVENGRLHEAIREKVYAVSRGSSQEETREARTHPLKVLAAQMV